MPCLADRYRLILYHRRGYAGSSRADTPVSVARQAADCRALLRHTGVERAHIVGHSYGGAVALQLALDAPGVVHSLALLEPALMVGASAQGYRESLARGVARYREAGAAVVVDEFLRARWPSYRAELDRALPGAFAQAVADAGTTFEVELPALSDWAFGEAEARQKRVCVEPSADWALDAVGAVAARAIDAAALGARVRIPTQAGHRFRADVGHRSDLMPARIPR